MSDPWCSCPARRPGLAARVTLVAALAALILPGCFIFHSTSGQPMSFEQPELEIGLTTKAEALAILGPPRSIRRQFDGDLFFYSLDDDSSARLLLIPFVPLYSRTRGTSRRDSLALLFDKHGVLSGVGVQRDIPVDE